MQVEVFIEQIERVNPMLNAYAHKRFADAREEAQRADATLRAHHGDKPLPPFLGVSLRAGGTG